MIDTISIGKVVGAFGIQGWLKIVTDSSAENLDLYNTIKIGNHTHLVKEHFLKGRVWHVRLAEINNRNSAEDMVGEIVYISKSQLPKTSKDEYYWADLISLTVVNQQNETIGTVVDMMDASAHSVLVIDGENKQHLIPFVAAYILDVNIADKIISVDWGLDY